MAERTLPPPGYETRDAPPRLPLYLGAGIGGTVLVVLMLIRLFYPSSARDLPKPDLEHWPPPPALQIAPYADLARLRAAETQRLESYGWVDRGRGIVHVPIEDAMRRVAQQGIRGWPAPAP